MTGFRRYLNKEEKAIIYRMNETGVQNYSNQVRGYAPKGHAPFL